MAELGVAAIVAANIVADDNQEALNIAPAPQEDEAQRLEREREEISQLLNWIGFGNEANVESIVVEAFDSYSDFDNLTEKDIQTLSTGFSSRTGGDGRIVFGLKRTKRLVALIHWCHDFSRTSRVPSIQGLTQQAFLLALRIATERSAVRKLMVTQSDAKSKAASPGPLISEAIWEQWEPKFKNYLSSILGVTGVPLLYVVRENVLPQRVGAFSDFIEQTIMQAPLAGTAYYADRVTVQHALVSFTTGQLSETWIKSLARFRDGRRSMKALQAHFSGEGNTSRRIERAEQLKTSIHYKNEGSLKFEVFLTRCQEMFGIYEQHEEPMSVEAQVRFLFNKINNAGLESTIAALKVDIMQKPKGSVTYTMVANHLAAAVSALPENKARGRSISAITSGGSSNIRDADGKIKTGTYSNWHELSQEEKKLVGQERSRLGVRPPRRGGGNNNNNNGTGSRQPFSKQNKDLKSQNQKYRRQIKALKRTTRTTEDNEEEETPENDAGNHFGGRNAKKTKRN